jgi:GntR family transcriptional repressor for pyruvate dehydrogenase complex
MFRPANKSTLHDDVLAQMMDAVSRKIWVPGSRLPSEQLLAKQFNVSRNCIREVLKALELSGVLEAYPGSGTFLSSNALRQINGSKVMTAMLTESSLRELMEMRCLIEGQTACWAAERGSDSQIGELEKILTRKEESVIDNHRKFHDALMKMAGNSLLSRFLESVRDEMEFSRCRFRNMSAEALEIHNSNHLRIYERIEARDGEGARKAMVDHILSAWQYLLEEGVVEQEDRG